jgi:hypothetical protein
MHMDRLAPNKGEGRVRDHFSNRACTVQTPHRNPLPLPKGRGERSKQPLEARPGRLRTSAACQLQPAGLRLGQGGGDGSS